MKRRILKRISYVTALAMMITVFNLPLLGYADEAGPAVQNGFGVAVDYRTSGSYTPITVEGVVVDDLLDENLDPDGEGPNHEFEITYNDGIFEEDPDNLGQDQEDPVPEGVITITSSNADVAAPILQKRVYNEETDDYDYIYQNDLEATSKLDVDDEGFTTQYFTLFYTGLGQADITMTFTYPDGKTVIMAQFPVKVKGVTVNLEQDILIYDGKAKTPAVAIEDWQGNVVGTENYTVEYEEESKAPGVYLVTITFTADYTGYQGTLYTWYLVMPKAPSSVSTRLTGHDDVKVTWKKSFGADGYAVYYKKGSGSYKFSKRVEGTSATIKNLSDGAKYTFKIVPYMYVDGAKINSTAYKTASIYTLKKISTPKVTKSGSKVKVKWTNISGETGYQISKHTKKSGTKIVATYKTTKGTYKKLSANKGTKYYYKVRAYKSYKVDGKTVKVYGPWSTPKAYKR